MSNKQPTKKCDIKGQWLKPFQSTLSLLASNSVYALGTMKGKDRETRLKAEYDLAVSDFLDNDSVGRLSKCFERCAGATGANVSLKFKDIFPLYAGMKKSLYDANLLTIKTISTGFSYNIQSNIHKLNIILMQGKC